MTLYLDSAYVAKCYLNDPDAPAVRTLVQKAEVIHSSALCMAEVVCAIQRHVRERSLRRSQGAELRYAFLDHVTKGVWTLIPVSEDILRDVDRALGHLPPNVYLRAGDAIHLVSARAAGFSDIWSNDRHLLEAARHFKLHGRSI